MKNLLFLLLSLFLSHSLSAQELSRDTVINLQPEEDAWKPSALNDTVNYKLISKDSTVYYWLTSWNRVKARIVDDEMKKMVSESEYILREVSCDTIDLVEPDNGKAFAKSIYCRQATLKHRQTIFYDEKSGISRKETYKNGELISSEF